MDRRSLPEELQLAAAGTPCQHRSMRFPAAGHRLRSRPVAGPAPPGRLPADRMARWCATSLPGSLSAAWSGAESHCRLDTPAKPQVGHSPAGAQTTRLWHARGTRAGAVVIDGGFDRLNQPGAASSSGLRFRAVSPRAPRAGMTATPGARVSGPAARADIVTLKGRGRHRRRDAPPIGR